MLQQQRRVVPIETKGPAKPEAFATWPFREKVCPPPASTEFFPYLVLTVAQTVSPSTTQTKKPQGVTTK